MTGWEMSFADQLRCFGWSRRAWYRSWRAFVQKLADWQGDTGLEVGAGAHSSLAPLMLAHVKRVECSALHSETLSTIEARNSLLLPASVAERITYTVQDVRALKGCWDMIVLKSVLGGVFRTHGVQRGALSQMQELLVTLVREHLRPGGWLVSLDNGRTAFEPLLAPFGARRSGWRFLERKAFPATDFDAHFGVLSLFSTATRLGTLGHGIDNALYAVDTLLSPLVHLHAVHLHAWRRPL